MNSTTFQYLAYICYGIAIIYTLAIVIYKSMNINSSYNSNKDKFLKDLAQKINNYENNSDHSNRLSELAESIAVRYSLPPEEINILKNAALLHDIGELDNMPFIKDNKRLSQEQQLILQQHPILGEEIANEIFPEQEFIGSIIKWHHENWDGTGYPDNLMNENIPLLSRILRVVDAYDAMISDRPHRQALSKEQAINELKRMSGIMFDPQVVNVLIDIINNEQSMSN